MLQFAVSIGLIICTAVIYGQTVYARTVDPGYNRDHILQVEELGRAQLWPKAEGIVEQMQAGSRRRAVGLTDIGVATDNTSNTFMLPPGSNKQVLHRHNIMLATASLMRWG